MIEAMTTRARRGPLAAMAAIALLLGGCGLTPEQESAAIERGIFSNPGTRDLWQIIKTEYPQDFDALISQLRAIEPAKREDDEVVKAVAGQWLQEFFATVGPDAIKAPADELLAWSAAEHELYATLQRGAVPQCAGMTMGQFVVIDERNAAATAAVTRRNAAMIRAASAGKRNPQVYGEPDDAAFLRYGDAIAATGIDPQLHATLGSEAAMQALTPAQQCELGVAIYAALTALPDDVEPEMAAYMLAIE